MVLNQIGRILFLKRDYAEAVAVLKQVCDVDPEDLQMHYTLMLCYRGLGDEAAAAARGDNCSGDLRLTNRRRRLPSGGACRSPKTTTSGRRSTITRAS